MDYSLLNGIGSYMLLGQVNGISSYMTNPYLTSPYLSGLYSSQLTSQNGIASIFQSGVRFGQALEKAKENSPETAEQLQKALEEAFGSKSSGKTVVAGSSGKTAYGSGMDSAAVSYEPSWTRAERAAGSLESRLAGRRASRAQQRQASRQL